MRPRMGEALTGGARPDPGRARGCRRSAARRPCSGRRRSGRDRWRASRRCAPVSTRSARACSNAGALEPGWMVDLAGRGQGRWSIRCVWACVDVGAKVRVVSASLPSLALGPGIQAGTTLQSVIPGGGREDAVGGYRAEGCSSSFRREAGIQGHGGRRRSWHRGVSGARTPTLPGTGSRHPSRADGCSPSFRREAGIQGHGGRRRCWHRGAGGVRGLAFPGTGSRNPAGTTGLAAFRHATALPCRFGVWRGWGTAVHRHAFRGRTQHQRAG